MPEPKPSQEESSDLRLRLRTMLVSLEDRDLSNQTLWGALQMAKRMGTQWEIEMFIKEALLGLENCHYAGKKQRYK